MSALLSSTSIIIATHLAALPARYAVGRWNNIPLSNILVFNGIDLGTNTAFKVIAELFLDYFKVDYKDKYLPIGGLILSTRVMACTIAYYGASYLKKPLPPTVACASNLAAFATFAAGHIIDTGLGNP